MRSFWKLTWTEVKLYFRFPVMAFFTLVVPLMLLFLFGGIFGNAPNPDYGGYGTVDVTLSGYIALIICLSAILTLPITLTNYRERGVLRRYRATPLRPTAVLGAQLVMVFGMTLAGMGLLILGGKLVFDLRFNGNPLSMLAAFMLSCLSFFALGMILAGAIPSVRMAALVGNVLIYPMIYLSGATIPMEIMPDTMRNIARFIPLTYVVTLLQGLWKGDPWSQHLTEVAVLSVMLVVCSIVAIRVFRWE
jgi:ABC-2 type transport system permease protein